jgi:DMSO/TMAO reductase YedYZ molybdopterin-dependent catalytic subunit
MAADLPDGIGLDELQLATRNHGMPLEALRYDLTPLGLHYLLIHYDIPAVDPDRWTLTVDGAVARPLRLSLEDLRRRPAETRVVTLECAGNGRARLSPRPLSQPWLLEAVGTAEWAGVPLRDLLQEAGVGEDAVEVLFTGMDRGVEGEEEQQYARSLPLAVAVDPAPLLAHEVNGVPLPPQHGFPLRLVVPGWYGMASVKWLERITVLTEPHTGYQNARGYRLRADEADPGIPVTRIAPRSLMVPPGIPDFMTRARHVPLGPRPVEGRAWSGHGAIVAVELSDDGGRTWLPARVEPRGEPHGWQRWRRIWEPRASGTYELCCRARDAAGNQQPLAPEWNLGGYMNNAVQRVEVVVG